MHDRGNAETGQYTGSMLKAIFQLRSARIMMRRRESRNANGVALKRGERCAKYCAQQSVSLSR